MKTITRKVEKHETCIVYTSMTVPMSATCPPVLIDSVNHNHSYFRGSHLMITSRKNIHHGFCIEDFTTNTRPDDEAYKVPAVALALPRGYSIISDNETGQVLCIIRGIRKFGYKADATAYGWNGASASTITPGRQWMFTEKENGCCFHLSGFVFRDQFHWVIGSKNVHLVFANHEQIADYTAVRFGVATILAKQWLDMISAMDSSVVDELKAWIVSNSVTLIGESIRSDDQHIVSYHENTIRFYNAISSPIPSDAGGCWLDDITEFTKHDSVHGPLNGGMIGPLVELFHIFDRFSLPRVEYFMASTDEDRVWLSDQYARKLNSEGAVIYTLNEDGAVDGIFKHKNHVYVVLRRMREQMKMNTSLAGAMTAVDKLFTEKIVQRECLPDEFYTDIKPMYAFFMVAYGVKFRQNTHRYPEIIREYYARKFEKDWVTEASRVDDGGMPGIILCGNGVPGSGKTTLFTEIARMYEGTYIDQDMCGGNARLFHAKLAELAKKLKTTPVPSCGFHLVAVGKRLTMFSTFKPVVETFPSYGVVFCDFARDTDDLEAYYQRAILRSGPGSSLNVMSDAARAAEAVGDMAKAEEHRQKLRSIVFGSARDIEVPSCVVPLAITRQPIEVNVRLITERIKEATVPATSRPPVQYVALKCDSTALYEAIGDVDMSGYTLHPELHVTLCYRPTPEAVDEYGAHEGASVNFRLVSVHRGDSFVVAKVEPVDPPVTPFVRTKRTPHITLGRKDGVHGVKQMDSPNAFDEDVDGVVIMAVLTGTIEMVYA